MNTRYYCDISESRKINPWLLLESIGRFYQLGEISSAGGWSYVVREINSTGERNFINCLGMLWKSVGESKRSIDHAGEVSKMLEKWLILFIEECIFDDYEFCEDSPLGVISLWGFTNDFSMLTQLLKPLVNVFFLCIYL